MYSIRINNYGNYSKLLIKSRRSPLAFHSLNIKMKVQQEQTSAREVAFSIRDM